MEIESRIDQLILSITEFPTDDLQQKPYGLIGYIDKTEFMLEYVNLSCKEYTIINIDIKN